MLQVQIRENEKIELGNQDEKITVHSGWFTADEVHDAYLKGKEKGKMHYIDGFEKTLNYNLPLATAAAELLFSKIEKLNINIQEAYLRIEDIARFGVLIIVPKDFFLSKDMKEAYLYAAEIENEDYSFEICFSFTMQSSNLLEESINADGYKIKYIK